MEDRQTTVEKFRSACEEGNFETALQLIGSGECRPSRLLKGGYACLHYAAAHGNLDVVRTLIETHRCKPNSKGGAGYTSLHFACYYGHIDVVKYLVSEQKCSPYRLSDEGFSPLWYAANAHTHFVCLLSQAVQDARHFEIVKFLVLECPCILNRHGKLTALSRILHMACRYGTLEDIKCFIEKGFKVQAWIANLKDCHPKEYDIPRYQRNPITYNTLVHVACMNGRLEVVKYLIENEHCDPQECNSNGDNAAHIACRNGNIEVLKYLLEEQKLELTICNTLGNTLLHLVCMNEHLESATVEYLIEKGCKPNIENKCGELPLYLACQNQSLDIIKLVSAFTKLPEVEVKTTPVHIACSKGSLETVQHLVKERHWNPKCEDSNGLTPLHHACGYKSSHTHGHHGQLRRVVNLELVLFLVKECGCDPMKSINPPIALACEECDVELVKALISSDVNCRDSSGNSPLHLACKYKAKKILRYLIEEAKCDPTIQNSMGELPLHIACEQTSLEMVKLVSDCNVNSRTVDGDTPLHIACEHGALDIARYLIQIKGCSPPQHRELYHNLCIHATCESEDMTLIKSIATPENVNNFCTYTLDNYERFESFESYESFESFEADAPLHIACKNGKLELVQFLVQEMNASVSVVNGNKKLPLHFACIHDSLEMVQLVSGCEDVDRKDSQGDTSLHIACRCGNFDIAKYLIMKRKCDPTIRNSNEELPLHYACMHSLEMVRFIIDVCQQSLVSTTTDKGATPLHFACLYGKLEVVKFLTEEREANPSVHDKKGLTPLHYACGICSYSNPDPIDSESMAAIAKYLVIRHECNPLENKNTVYQYYMDHNYSPLEKAVVEGNLELVKALTSGNLNIDYLNSSGESMLHEACAHHQHDIVEFLVTGRYCNQEVQNRSGQTALHIACRTGCLDTVRLVSSNCDVNMQTIDGDTPLHIACQHCHISITKFLTEVRRSNLSIPNSQGEMALHIACKQNSLALVKLCSNCDVNAKSQNEDTPLHIALKRRQGNHVTMQGYQIIKYLVTEKQTSRHFDVDENEQIVKYLVTEKQCDVSLLDEYGCLPLHVACQCDSLALVKLVSNCNVNATTKKGDTPLHTVIQRIKEHVALKEIPKEGYEIVQYLVSEKHCNLTLPDEKGCIPLHIACQQGSLPLVEFGSYCARTHGGDTPLHKVLKEKTVMESIIKVLVGVDGSIVNVCNKDGNTPLHLVCSDLQSQRAIGFLSFLPSSDHRPDHLVECLIGDNAECDVSITNSTNKSALHLACAAPTMPLKVIELLLRRSTSNLCNSKDHLGDTPLHIACRRALPTFADYLIKSQLCDADIQNNEEELPLHIACRNSTSSFNSVIKMLSCQCRLNCTNKTGDTPLHILCRIGNFEAIQELVFIQHCDTDIQNLDGEVPLHLAIGCSFNQKIIELVGAHCHHSPNIQTKSGDTLLHIACKHGELHAIEYLTERMHCDPSIQNKSGLLPLHYASHHSVAVARLVRDCDPNLQCITEHEFKYRIEGEWYRSTCRIETGDTPLHVACRNGRLKMISFLVKEMKCNVNVPNSNEETPLHIVCHSGLSSLNILKLVKRCKPNAQTKCGDTPLHIAVGHASTSTIKYLVKQMKCNVNIPNKNGQLPLHLLLHQEYKEDAIPLVVNSLNVNSKDEQGNAPLHIACLKFSRKTIEYLSKIKGCDLNITNNDGDLPLHVVCRTYDNHGFNVVKLMSASNVNVNTRNSAGNTPLHEACQFESEFDYRNGCLPAVQHLILEKKCNPSICNEQHELPLHVASRRCSLEIVKLVSGVDDVNSQTISGNTPLHEACQFVGYSYKCVETVQHLILEKNCNPSICNEQHELPLHLACRKCSLEIVKLVSGVDDVNSQTTSGNTPLHEACQFNESESDYSLETVQYLILEKNCNPSICNKQYELPLHLASRRGSLEIVKLVSKVDDMNLQTISGNTPLHEACMSTFYHLKELLEFLIEKGCKTKCQNDVGKTPLHCLCESRSSTTAIEYLLSISKSELSVADNEGQTPIMLTTNLSITKILLKHGADATPLYEMHRDFFKTKTPPPTPLNVLVVGNAAMGKTTLIESLKNEFCETVLVEPQLHTAGIIPNDFESKVYGSVIFYDFAGQHEYYASHEAVVHNIIKHSSPVILLVINITETKNEMWKKLAYWTVLIESRCTTLREKPHLIVVGSHLDQVKETDCINAKENLSLLTASLQSRLEKSPLRFITHVAMDCRQSQSPGIEKLRHILHKSSEKLRDNAVMDFNCHCFCVFLQDKLNHFTALPVEHITNAIISYGRQTPDTSITENFLSPNTQDVAKICEELSNMGHLLFLKNHSRLEMSWVILKKECLLSTVNGTVFAPHSFKQHTDLSSSTGVVPFQKIATYFPRYDPNMIVGFLSHLEFCQEIHDQEVLDLLAPYDRASSTQRYFFFPRLVSIETPQGVWKQDPNYGYQWGWMLYCTNSEEFFTPHFLQVLILRLAFSFALTVLSKRPYWDEIPALKRACSVWKKGICWTATAGIEATVEVIEQNQAVVAMVRSHKKVSEAECIQLRSSIMRKVLQAKQTFCPNVSTAESFIHPKHLCYPLPCIREMNLFSLPIVAKAIVQINPFAVTESGELLSIDELICFEPYSCLGESMLQKLFNQENAGTIVTDDFLQNMAGAIVENTDDHTTLEFKRKVFMKVFKISPVAIKEATHDSDLETERLFRIFQVWRSHSDGTYQCLRQKLDDFSLFHGRNPLEMVPAASQQATQFIRETSKSTHCTEHSHTLASSHEYDRMLHNFDKIIEQLADAKCSGQLADKLYSRELISKQVHEEGVNFGPGVVESGRIRCMIKAVLAKVRTNTEHCSTFIKILEKIGGQKDLLQLLQGPENMDV